MLRPRSRSARPGSNGESAAERPRFAAARPRGLTTRHITQAQSDSCDNVMARHPHIAYHTDTLAHRLSECPLRPIRCLSHCPGHATSRLIIFVSRMFFTVQGLARRQSGKLAVPAPMTICLPTLPLEELQISVCTAMQRLRSQHAGNLSSTLGCQLRASS